MDKLKYIRVQQDDGVTSTDIPIAVDAENVEMRSGQSLETALSDMQASADIVVVNDEIQDITKVSIATTDEEIELATVGQVQTAINNVNDRIDNIISSVTVDTEVQDARQATDGTIYDVLKSRLDAEHTDLKNAIEKNTEIDIIDGWESGYYASSSSVTSIDINTRTSSAFWMSIAISCQSGDVFVYTGTGSASARSWALLSSANGSNNIVSKAAAGSYEDNVITIPDGVAYIVFNTLKNSTHFVTKGNYLIKQVDDNTAKASGAISALKAISQSGTGSVLLADMAYCTGIRATGATGLTVSTAQLCESKYSGTSSINGVSFRRNVDGSYTINGTATGSTLFYINQSTRTGTDNPITLSGTYTMSVEKMGGSYDNGNYTGSSSLIFGIKNTSQEGLMAVVWGRNGDRTSKSENITANALVFVQIAAGVIYNNLTFRIMFNSGDTVLPWSPYKSAVSATLDDVVEKVNGGYLPNAIITATPATTDIVAVGVSVVSDGDEESAQIDLYGVLEKYNDRVDTLAQLFSRPLFLIYTDIHGNNVNLNRINTWYKSNKPVYIRDVYCLGDMVDDQSSDPITQFEDIQIWGKTLKVIGNHDVLASGTIPGITSLEAYNKYIAPDVASWEVTQPTDAATNGLNYYYKDYNSVIRIIVLDTYFYTTAQHTWFVNTLADARTNNLSVIVMQHEDICTPAEKHPLNADYPFAKKQGGYTMQYRTYGDGGNYQTKRAAVDDFIGAGGKFICWVSGHTHADETGTYDGGTNGKQLSVVLSNASNSMISSMRINGYCQDCFTYIGVDTSLGCIYLLRIGVDIDKWFHQNLFLCYDYVNHSVVEYH